MQLPDHPDLYVNLSAVLEAQNRLDEAAAALEAAIRFRPDYAEAYHNLGVVLKKLDRIHDAISAYRRALAIKPEYSAALNNLANILSASGDSAEAVDLLQRAVANDPRSPHALCNLGGMLHESGRTNEAIAILQQAIALDPKFAGAYLNLGHALAKAERLDEAAAALRRAIDIQPNFTEAHGSLGLTLHRLGELDAAIAAVRMSLKLNPNQPQVHSNLILLLHYHPRVGPSAILAEQKEWAKLHAPPARNAHGNDPDPARRIRLGYVSGDLCNHVMAQNLLPMFQAHDHGAFEVFLYCNNARDAATPAIEACADHWRSISHVDDAPAAELIRADRIDVLVDLSQHTGRNRLPLLAHRPAPVQIAFGAYPGGVGMEAMNYRISDPHLDPPENRAHYVEETLYLPDSFWLYSTADPEPVGEPPAERNGSVTFGCLNNFCKINDEVWKLWTTILARVPDSRLVLLGGDESQRRQARTALNSDRVDLLPRRPRRQYLREFHRFDVGLDTFPYNGHISSLDALWMGIPVVTLAGERAVSRGGLSLLKNLDLAEFAASDPEQYVQIAMNLAGDLPRLAELRRTLRQRLLDSPLTDAKRFAANIESLYRQAWRKWCDGRITPRRPSEPASSPSAPRPSSGP